MIVCKCIQKFRDGHNKIYGYRLQDVDGNVQDVIPEKLKQAIVSKQIQVINLTLTSDNRLIDCECELLKSNKLGEAPKKPSYDDMSDKDKEEYLEKAVDKLLAKTKFSEPGNLDYTEINEIDIDDKVVNLYMSIRHNLIDCSIDISDKSAKFFINDADEDGDLNGNYKGTISCADISIESFNKTYECIESVLEDFNGREITIVIDKGKVTSRIDPIEPKRFYIEQNNKLMDKISNSLKFTHGECCEFYCGYSHYPINIQLHNSTDIEVIVKFDSDIRFRYSNGCGIEVTAIASPININSVMGAYNTFEKLCTKGEPGYTIVYNNRSLKFESEEEFNGVVRSIVSKMGADELRKYTSCTLTYKDMVDIVFSRYRD